MTRRARESTTQPYSIRISGDLLKRLEAYSRSEHRSVNNTINHALQLFVNSLDASPDSTADMPTPAERKAYAHGYESFLSWVCSDRDGLKRSGGMQPRTKLDEYAYALTGFDHAKRPKGKWEFLLNTLDQMRGENRNQYYIAGLEIDAVASGAIPSVLQKTVEPHAAVQEPRNPTSEPSIEPAALDSQKKAIADNIAEFQSRWKTREQ
jgi:hypothetical protein